MTCQYYKLLFFLLFNFLLIESASSQHSFFKFKIAEEGIYRISTSQAQKLGFNSLDEVAIFGYPGMLPQLVQSDNLELQEIPSLEKDGSLYVYLSSPHSYAYNEDGIDYRHNHYADSISYLIGTTRNPIRIPTEYGKAGTLAPSVLYQWNWLKEEENNILNSGRVWYSRAVAPGITRGYSIRLKTNSSASWKLFAKVMGRSSTESKVSLAADELLIAERSFGGIPSSKYANKGQESSIEENFFPAGNTLERLRISFQSSDLNGSGYFEFIGIGVPHTSDTLDEGVYSSANAAAISLVPLAGLSIWEVSNFFNPKELDLSSGSIVSGQKFQVFNKEETKEISQIEPTDLKLRTQSSWPELLIIAPKNLSASAEKLSVHKMGMGIYAEVMYLEEIYDSFGYGNPDLNAIRNLIAWHYHQGGKLQNVLILGKGTFDYKGILGGRPNLVPIYTSRNSLNPLTTFSSDDYFSLLEFGQGEWEESREGDQEMLIGVGRLPVINAKEAKIVVDKIIDYESKPKVGDWKKTVTFFADDGDNNTHLRDSEFHSSFLNKHHKEYKQVKFYLDRFDQVQSGDNQSSPKAKTALQEVLDSGTLLLNYIGHGNETTLTAEEVFMTSDIPNWPDQDYLPLWITATCEFGRHDSPFLRSAAEELLISPNKGAIGLLSTGRPVFSSVNFSLNEAFIEEVFRLENGQMRDLGEIFRNTKNKSQNGALNRNFSLLADPSLKLAAPEFQIEIISMKDPTLQNSLDTLSAFQEVEFEAEVINPSTERISTSFNGIYTIEVHDKPTMNKTLGNESSPAEFEEENMLIFKGKGEIVSGKIKGKMVIPKNISPEFGEGSIRIFGENLNQTWEAFGFSSPLVGGISNKAILDREGPEITASFGGKDQAPFTFPSKSIEMIAHISDSSGINISDLLPSEKLTVQVNQGDPIPLTKYFTSHGNSYIKGKVTFVLKDLNEGKNNITIRAWDILGNESEFIQELLVEGSDKLRILSHKTYPNPTQIDSHFELEHNQPGENLLLTLGVYQVDGKILFTESLRLVHASAHIDDLVWFFLQNQTKYPAKGSYIYKLSLQSELDNSTASVSGQIVIQ